MIQRIHQIDIDINNTQTIKSGIEFVSGDSETNILNFNILKDGLPLDLTGVTRITLTNKRVDNVVIIDDVTVKDALNGKLAYTIRTNIIAIEGLLTSTLELYGLNGERLSSNRIFFSVKGQLDNGSAIPSTNEYPILTNLINEVQNLDIHDKMDILTYDSNANGKVDVAEVAESVAWANVQNKPTSEVIDIDDAVTKKHEHTNKPVLDGTEESFTTALKTKVDGISTGANKVEDSVINGNIKIDGIENNVYTHPANHTPSIVTQDANNRFVSDAEKSTWNAKATTGYVDTKVASVVDSAPETLNTLHELSIALGEDPNFATTVANQIGTKVDKVTGKQLSTEDYTTTEKSKLAGVANNANNYVHPANHVASVITQDTTHRFVSDTEKTNWNEKATTTYVSEFVSNFKNYLWIENKTILAGSSNCILLNPVVNGQKLMIHDDWGVLWIEGLNWERNGQIITIPDVPILPFTVNFEIINLG